MAKTKTGVTKKKTHSTRTVSPPPPIGDSGFKPRPQDSTYGKAAAVIGDEEYDRFSAYAKEQGMTNQDLLRLAVNDYMNRVTGTTIPVYMPQKGKGIGAAALSFVLGSDTLARLRATAIKTDMDRSALVREAVNEYLNKRK